MAYFSGFLLIRFTIKKEVWMKLLALIIGIVEKK